LTAQATKRFFATVQNKLHWASVQDRLFESDFDRLLKQSAPHHDED